LVGEKLTMIGPALHKQQQRIINLYKNICIKKNAFQKNKKDSTLYAKNDIDA
jgi:hypothetical protein